MYIQICNTETITSIKIIIVHTNSILLNILTDYNIYGEEMY